MSDHEIIRSVQFSDGTNILRVAVDGHFAEFGIGEKYVFVPIEKLDEFADELKKIAPKKATLATRDTMQVMGR
ncbi:hypothetical protein BH762_gp103 [Gordonia phage OneUp]|uniref:Uncharacterized protein n=1 Tax=Gordonia phage OneUp TaxID=1838074 RepID=A0A160DER1_9CAUD|nr:hypothetical protein BH762_gp103 [Gordonia phage OneUp]ANA86416.1 hypothetical protein PBI_ONEUP_82 [Gordonia phage OneUp]